MAAFPKHRSAVLSGPPEGPLRNGARSRREPGGALKGPERNPGRTPDVKYLAISVAWMDRDGGPRRGLLVPARHGCELSHRDVSRRPVERAGTSLATAPHRRCVGCESRAAEGRREDPTQGTERRGERFRNRNRREPPRRVSGRAATRPRARRCSRMRTPASQADARGRSHRAARRRGVARGRRSRQGRARRSLRRAWRAAPAQGEHGGGGNAGPARHAAAANRQAAASNANRRAKRSAERAQRAEARGIPARRAETAQRTRQGSPVA